MTKSDLPSLTISELQKLLRGREISPREVLEALHERIETLDPQIDAYLSRGVGPGAERVFHFALAEGAARKRRHQYGLGARSGYLINVAPDIDGELGGEVSGSAWFSGLIVVPELNQDVGGGEVAGGLQHIHHLVP